MEAIPHILTENLNYESGGKYFHTCQDDIPWMSKYPQYHPVLLVCSEKTGSAEEFKFVRVEGIVKASNRYETNFKALFSNEKLGIWLLIYFDRIDA